MSKSKNLKKTLKKQTKKIKVKRLGNIKSEEIQVLVDNPSFTRDHPISNANSKSIIVHLNSRQNVIARWYRAGKIKLPEKMAAEKFARLHYNAEISPVRSIDYESIRVDCSTNNEVSEIKNTDSNKTMMHLQKVFLNEDYQLLENVIVHCVPFSKLCKNRRQEDVMSLHCRSLLTKLAQEFGYG